MGDMGDMYREMKDERKEHRRKHGVECPKCPPNRNASILLPQQRCGFCGYKDPRPYENRRSLANGDSQ